MPIDDSFYKSASDSLPCEEGVPIRFRFREIAWGPAVPLQPRPHTRYLGAKIKAEGYYTVGCGTRLSESVADEGRK